MSASHLFLCSSELKRSKESDKTWSEEIMSKATVCLLCYVTPAGLYHRLHQSYDWIPADGNCYKCLLMSTNAPIWLTKVRIYSTRIYEWTCMCVACSCLLCMCGYLLWSHCGWIERLYDWELPSHLRVLRTLWLRAQFLVPFYNEHLHLRTLCALSEVYWSDSERRFRKYV